MRQGVAVGGAVCRNAGKRGEPRQDRAEPELPFGHEFAPLGQYASANAQAATAWRLVGRGIERRAAIGTEGLLASATAVSRLDVDPGLAFGQVELLFWTRDHYPERGAGQLLAIGTMADADAVRVDLGLEGYGAAMA